MKKNKNLGNTIRYKIVKMIVAAFLPGYYIGKHRQEREPKVDLRQAELPIDK